MAESEKLSPEMLQDLLISTLERGLTLNGGPRYRLTSEALKILMDRSTQTIRQTKSAPVVSKDEIEETDEPVYPYPQKIIKPEGFPLLADDSLDFIQHEANVKIVKRTGYRILEIFAELELCNGVIYFTGDSPAAEVRKRLAADISYDSYAKSLGSMEKNGYVSVDFDRKVIVLTPAGEKRIALLKTYHSYLKDPKEKPIRATTGLRIIEHVMFMSGIYFDETTAESSLPLYSDWIAHPNNTQGIIPDIARALDITEDTATRRIYELRKNKKYLEAIIRKDGSILKDTLTNLRLTREGLKFALRAMHELRELEEVIGEDEAAEADKLLGECRELASISGNYHVKSYLNQRYADMQFFELSRTGFDAEIGRLRELKSQIENNDVPAKDFLEATA